MLRLVEREGQWFEASTTNWRAGAANYEDQLEVFERVELPERTVTDRATISAHLNAYGSTKVRDCYKEWRSTITAIEHEYDSWGFDWRVNGVAPSFDHITRVQDVLHSDERDARRAFGDAVAQELGRRRPAAARWRDRLRARAHLTAG